MSVRTPARRGTVPGRVPMRDPTDHPAVEAWRRLVDHAAAVRGIETLKPAHRKSAVYRVTWAGEGEGSLVAKRAPVSVVRHEARVYALLERLEIPAPRLRAVSADGDADGETRWIFLEDAGDVGLDTGDIGHRRLAGSWLGTLHRVAAAPSAHMALPDRSDLHYRATLERARGAIARGRDHPRVDDAGSARLTRLDAGLGRLEELWSVVRTGARSLPSTLVHGDFVGKNVRVRTGDVTGAARLLALDWETSGYGSPAVDLEHVDLEAYADAYGRDALTASSLDHAARSGRAFRLVLEIEWASRALDTPWPDATMHRYLPTYERWLDRLLRAFEARP